MKATVESLKENLQILTEEIEKKNARLLKMEEEGVKDIEAYERLQRIIAWNIKERNEINALLVNMN